MKIPVCVINGPNLNLLAKREPSIYGNKSLSVIIEELEKKYPQIELHHFQSNSEGALIDAVQKLGAMCSFGIINGAGYTHTSVSLRDAVAAVDCKFVEVHLSNIYQREAYRKESYLSEVTVGCLTGFGAFGYHMAMEYIIENLADLKP